MNARSVLASRGLSAYSRGERRRAAIQAAIHSFEDVDRQSEWIANHAPIAEHGIQIPRDKYLLRRTATRS